MTIDSRTEQGTSPAWIEFIAPERASGALAAIYRQLGWPGIRVDHVLQVHSLVPHTLTGHLGLYRAVLHHPDNRLQSAFSEALGVLVSRINGCAYCVAHHSRGLRRSLDNAGLAAEWLDALATGRWQVFTDQQRDALTYASRLTRSPDRLREDDVDTLRASGWSDAGILEINQIVAYFNYANRTVLGLGVKPEKVD